MVRMKDESDPSLIHPSRNDLPFIAQLVNRLEHLLLRHLGRIVTNVEQVFFQIDVNLLDA